MTKLPGLEFCLRTFDPDSLRQNVVVVRVGGAGSGVEQAAHSHRKGQLVLALNGWVTCQAPGATWLAPPQSAVWIPAGTPHSNHVNESADLCFLFVDPKIVAMPTRCCTLRVSPLLRELILHLAGEPHAYAPNGANARIAEVLLEQLAAATPEQLHLPTSAHPKVKALSRALEKDPSDRRTLAEWGKHLGMSDRTLARLIDRETGMTFGRWRQQLHLILAIRQLMSGATVQEIAGSLGYDSAAAFITMFKKAMGQPPRKYLAQLKT